MIESTLDVLHAVSLLTFNDGIGLRVSALETNSLFSLIEIRNAGYESACGSDASFQWWAREFENVEFIIHEIMFHLNEILVKQRENI